MLKKLTLSCLLLLYALTPRLSAQLPKASEYFPLEVGNVWEYEGTLRHEVVAETVIGDTARVYTVLLQDAEGFDSWQDAGYSFYGYSLDSSAIYEIGYFQSIDAAYESGVFPYIGINRKGLEADHKLLDTSHGFNWEWGHSEFDYYETLAVTDTGNVDLFGASRHFLDVNFVEESGDTLAVLWFDTQYVIGIGRSRLQYNGDLTYAKVGGIEYGTPLITAVNSSTSNQKVERGIHCYPNPVQGIASIILPASSSAGLNIYIMNSRGQTIRAFANVRKNKLNWDCRNDAGKRVPIGVYFIRAEDGQHRLMGKILVLR